MMLELSPLASLCCDSDANIVPNPDLVVLVASVTVNLVQRTKHQPVLYLSTFISVSRTTSASSNKAQSV